VITVEEAACDLNEAPAVIVLREKDGTEDKCAIIPVLTAVAQERLTGGGEGTSVL